MYDYMGSELKDRREATWKNLFSGDADTVYAPNQLTELAAGERAALASRVPLHKDFLDEEDLGNGPNLFMVFTQGVPCRFHIGDVFKEALVLMSNINIVEHPVIEHTRFQKWVWGSNCTQKVPSDKVTSFMENDQLDQLFLPQSSALIFSKERVLSLAAADAVGTVVGDGVILEVTVQECVWAAPTSPSGLVSTFGAMLYLIMEMKFWG
ncbi:hypothetical protein BS17DRAFT_769568 [Gyrodon lividus]|nr:hypothetical protein BS17DRAFT_769568 [Gyrodon lividus]